MTLRCLIVDDSRLYLEAARALLEREGIDVAGVASESAEALLQAEALRPDVILVDIVLGEESGLDLVRRLSEDSRAGGAALILISTHTEADFSALIDESPAAAFIPKPDLSAEAIRRALNGGASGDRVQ
ncbi:MAG TPA: response regulator transcription factor [Gaiellaceae bacterium]|jgi:DNA-binding NarL/FixJ family response regulator|nr:response regulator transcription factor [Gaiellaceae bacterium]